MGTVYHTIVKKNRKKFLSHMCEICSECINKCDRSSYYKCDKCQNCKICVKRKNACDRFYCYDTWLGQTRIDGKIVSTGTGKTKTQATLKKNEKEAQALTGNYVQKNGITLLPLIRKIDNEKINNGQICQNTQNKNKYIYKRIEGSNIDNIPIQNLTYKQLQDFLNSQKFYSQSEIDKVRQKLDTAYQRAVIDKIIAYADNPMLRVQTPISDKDVKKIEAFELEEEQKLLEYLADTDIIVKSNKSNYDNNTIRNLFIIALLTLTRVGELGALDYFSINFDNKELIIKNTLTKDENEKCVLGDGTKNRKARKLRGEADIHYVPFNLFDQEGQILEYIFKEQIKIAKTNKQNKNNLLFCQKNGKPLQEGSITNIFKRICREACIKLELSNGCSIHMTRHTRSYTLN